MLLRLCYLSKWIDIKTYELILHSIIIIIQYIHIYLMFRFWFIHVQ